MGTIYFLARVAMAVFVFSLPTMLLGGLLFGIKGGCFGLLLALGSVVLLLTFSERGVARQFRTSSRKFGRDFRGLEASLASVVQELGGGRPPQLVIFANPMPDGFTLRSFFSHGTLFLSQGLIALLTESELRCVLRQGILRIRSDSTRLQSFCSVLWLGLNSLLPPFWMDLALRRRIVSKGGLSGPVSVFGGLMLFPLIRFLVWLNFRSDSVGSQGVSLAVIQKVSYSKQILGEGHALYPFSLFAADLGANSPS